MGLTKQYRRFVPEASFGLIGSARGGLRKLPWKREVVATAAAERILLWNLRTGVRAGELVTGDEQQGEHEVTAMEAGERPVLAAGYHDGAVRIFDADAGGRGSDSL